MISDCEIRCLEVRFLIGLAMAAVGFTGRYLLRNRQLLKRAQQALPGLDGNNNSFPPSERF